MKGNANRSAAYLGTALLCHRSWFDQEPLGHCQASNEWPVSYALARAVRDFGEPACQLSRVIPMPPFSIRAAEPADVDELFEMIRELAVFEKLEDQLVTTPERLRTVLFEQSGGPEGLLAEDSQGALIGYALYFENFSSFLCRRGIYLEDLYVRPDSRGHGLGKAFLKRLAEIAVERECGRMEWTVLDWNTNAIEFYKSIGGKILDDWRLVRVDRSGIEQLAK